MDDLFKKIYEKLLQQSSNHVVEPSGNLPKIPPSGPGKCVRFLRYETFKNSDTEEVPSL